MNNITETDVVIIGSGGGGLSAAITAANTGLKVLVIEKTAYFGGTTAISGGGIWVPANHLAEASGLSDTEHAASQYIKSLVGDIVREDILNAFVTHAHQMLKFLGNKSQVQFALHKAEPDYYQELPGAVTEGRLLSPLDFDGRQLGEDLEAIRPPLKEFNAPMGFMINFDDIDALSNVGKSLKSTLHAMRLMLDYLVDRLRYSRGTRLTMGNALVARLLISARKAGVELRRNTSMQELVIDNGCVTGVKVLQDGKLIQINARRGVILASGGFSASLEMRRQFIPYPEQHVSFLPDGNTGDGLRSALVLGAELETGNHDDAAYTVMSVLHKPDGSLGKYPHVFLDRTKPGCIAVNSKGLRFGNEAAADFVKAIHNSGSVPAHLICDHVFIKKFGLGLVLPGGIRLGKMIKAGYIISAPTIKELAGRIGADADQLEATISTSNQYAKTGKDLDFNKGNSAVDRALGDAEHHPNPCLGAIAKAPFYAVQVFPGDGSTTLGLKTNQHAQVLKADTPIPGLYACGLDMNTLWRGKEPAHGSYNTLAMTFGYIAAKHIANDAS